MLEARIPANIERVWEIVTDGRRWALWNDRFEWMWPEGALQAGTVLTIKPRRGRQTAFVVEAAVRPRTFIFATSFGPAARMRFACSFEREAESSTLLRLEFSVEGPLAPLVMRFGGARLAELLPGDLERLAAYAAPAAVAPG